MKEYTFIRNACGLFFLALPGVLRAFFLTDLRTSPEPLDGSGVEMTFFCTELRKLSCANGSLIVALGVCGGTGANDTDVPCGCRSAIGLFGIASAASCSPLILARLAWGLGD